MKRNVKKEEKRRQDNKGFSLVELIVVIAIMAVLVAVMAPQFTKYVDRSRQSVDAATVAGIVSAVQVGVADVTEYTVENDTYTITLSDGAAVVKKGTTELSKAGTGSPKNLTDAIVDACGELSTLHVTAKAWDTVTITVKVAENVTVTYASAPDDIFADYIGAEKTNSTEATP